MLFWWIGVSLWNYLFAGPPTTISLTDIISKSLNLTSEESAARDTERNPTSTAWIAEFADEEMRFDRAQENPLFYFSMQNWTCADVLCFFASIGIEETALRKLQKNCTLTGAALLEVEDMRTVLPNDVLDAASIDGIQRACLVLRSLNHHLSMLLHLTLQDEENVPVSPFRSIVHLVVDAMLFILRIALIIIALLVYGPDVFTRYALRAALAVSVWLIGLSRPLWSPFVQLRVDTNL
jgi:hypothetical protein